MAEEKPKKTSKKKAEETPVEETAPEVVDEQPAQADATPTEAEVAAPEPDTQPEPEPEAVEEPAAEETPEPEAPAAEEPVAEEEPAEEPAAEAEEPAAEAEPEPEAPAAPAKPTKSRKHLPRSQRRQRSKPVREKPKQRKPIVRLEKPANEIGRHQERRGVVVSDAMDKTIVVKVDVIKIHPRYKKVIRRSRKFHAHDEQNQAHVGDVVRIVETRPLSKTKNWRLAEVVEVAK
jgi:small subunit ribosomal protein S17